MKGVLYTDGGARPNPGHSAMAYVLIINDKKYRHAGYLGWDKTNNFAEMMAILAGLKAAAERGVDSIEVRTDSMLCVRLVQSDWGTKYPHLKLLKSEIRKCLEDNFSKWHIKLIPRAENGEADELCTKRLLKEKNRNPFIRKNGLYKDKEGNIKIKIGKMY